VVSVILAARGSDATYSPELLFLGIFEVHEVAHTLHGALCCGDWSGIAGKRTQQAQQHGLEEGEEGYGVAFEPR
jgi:hypothetical protein